MDSELKTIMSLARQRGSKYLKMTHKTEEFSEQMAELGIYLLVHADALKTSLERKSPLHELNEIQNKIDHFRQTLFAIKRNVVK